MQMMMQVVESTRDSPGNIATADTGSQTAETPQMTPAEIRGFIETMPEGTVLSIDPGRLVLKNEY